MDEKIIYEVVTRLVGPIKPQGETHTDEMRLENIKILTKVIDRLLYDVTEIHWVFENRNEYSIKQIQEYCDKYLKETKDAIEETIDS